MAKYSYEFKKQIVLDYLSGKGNYEYLARQYGMHDKKDLRTWVNNYRAFGDSGLLRSRKSKTYTFEYKLHVIELYLSSEVSYQELAVQEGIRNPAQICKWVNAFQIAGPDALRPRKKGRKKSLDSININKIKPDENTSADTSSERIKQLEDELLMLRIENAYLKELRRLRLEEEALLRKQRESSTASEESSN